MVKDGVCTSAYFIEVRRWFNDKMNSWLKKNVNATHGHEWINILNDSHVYCREEDENDKPTGNWFRITGFEDHGDSVTLIIKKPNGKIKL